MMCTDNIQRFIVTQTYSSAKGRILESITYDERTANIYYIDVPGGLVYAEFNGEITRRFKVAASIGVIGLTTDPGKLICGINDGIIILDITTGETERKVFFPNKNTVKGYQLRSNDGSVAPDGSFWVGTMLDSEDQYIGSMWRYSMKNGLEQLWDNLGVPNGLNWDLERNFIYWTDSMKSTIYRGKYKTHYSIDKNSLTPWFVNKGEPDGSCIDVEGNLYIAIWGGHKVCRVTPGNFIDMEWSFPSKNIASCAFGGETMSTLYVSTADLTVCDIQDESDKGGTLFKIELKDHGIVGLPKHKFVL